MYNFYSKIVFTFLLLLITFELKQSYIPHLKVLMCSINAFVAHLLGDFFILCYTNLNLALLLHKTVLVNFPIATTLLILHNSSFGGNFNSNEVEYDKIGAGLGCAIDQYPCGNYCCPCHPPYCWTKKKIQSTTSSRIFVSAHSFVFDSQILFISISLERIDGMNKQTAFQKGQFGLAVQFQHIL